MSDSQAWFDDLRAHFVGHGTRLERIEHQLERLFTMSQTLAADVSALTTAVATLTQAISNEGSVIAAAVTEIKTLIAANAGTVDPTVLQAIENATAAISTATNNITNEGSTLAAALPPAV